MIATPTALILYYTYNNIITCCLVDILGEPGEDLQERGMDQLASGTEVSNLTQGRYLRHAM